TGWSVRQPCQRPYARGPVADSAPAQKVPGAGGRSGAEIDRSSGRRGPSCGQRRRAERPVRDVTMPAEQCPAAGGVIPSQSTSDDAMTDLVERDSELAAIANFVRRGGVMLIEAGAGVGKTSLLEATCAIAQRKKRTVLRARGSELERDFAFGVVGQLFERRFTDAIANDREALLAGPARPVTTLLQPA